MATGDIPLTQYPLPLHYETADSTTEPLAQFQAWQADMQDPVSWAYRGDDDARLLVLPQPWSLGGSDVALWGGEGGLGLYLDYRPPSDMDTDGDWTTLLGHWFWGRQHLPALLLTWHPTNSVEWKMFTQAQFASAGDALIHYGFLKDANYPNADIPLYEIAVRIRPLAVEIVGKAITPTDIRVFELPEPSSGVDPSTLSPISQTVVLAHASGIASVTLTLGTDTIDGPAKFTDGAIATKVTAQCTDTGAFAAEATPDPATGLYRLKAPPGRQVDVTICRSGYRPLTHGPL